MEISDALPFPVPPSPQLARRTADGRARGHRDEWSGVRRQPGHARQLTGLGFDQCEAPSQSAMSTWIEARPSGRPASTSPATPAPAARQTNLTPTWVRNQLAAGWHLMPITLGPQASCSSRYPRYGAQHRPDDQPQHREHLRRRPRPGPARGPAGRRRRPHPRHRAAAAPSSTTSRPSTPATAPPAPSRRCTSCTCGPTRCTPRLRLGLLLQRRVGHQDARRRPGARRATGSRCPTRSGSPTGTAAPTPPRPTSAATAGCPTAG